MSTSNDATIKIWDLRAGHILYTLYGHDGPTSSCTFSPGGDYFCSGGKDSVILIWRANLTGPATETLAGLAASKVHTDVYLTDKEQVGKLPKEKENK